MSHNSSWLAGESDNPGGFASGQLGEPSLTQIAHTGDDIRSVQATQLQ